MGESVCIGEVFLKVERSSVELKRLFGLIYFTATRNLPSFVNITNDKVTQSLFLGLDCYFLII